MNRQEDGAHDARTAQETGSPKTAAQVLREAAELIRQRGWTSGEACSPDGKLCVLGAIAVAGGVPVKPGDVWLEGADRWDGYLRATLAAPKLNAIWNDTVARTADEVIAALKAAATAANAAVPATQGAALTKGEADLDTIMRRALWASVKPAPKQGEDSPLREREWT